MERIARATLKDLGVFGAALTVTPDASEPGYFQIDIQGTRGPERLRIHCSQGTTAQWVRQQIFEKYLAQR